MRPRISFLITVLLLTTCSMFGQDQPNVETAKHRPTLGLVLEGGGALGLAHVGVITWLEEHRIPVDYVAGTSMGGLVGGVYATGSGAGELRKLVDGIRWDQVMSGKLPYRDLSFRRKEDALDYPNDLEFGLRKGVQFPAGFNTGQEVSLIIDRAALPYSQIGSFDNLPIPFGCVATNLVSGKPEVFRSGSLSTAMRATMSIPGVFTPVTGKDGIYADGGLLDNIPIDLARKMGAQVVLGVHLETAPLDPDTKLSSFAVLGRSISVVISANELLSMENADLIISVPLSKYDTMDFNKANEIIQAGYDAAAAKANVLMAFSVDQATWEQYLAARQARRKTAPVPQFVAVSTPSPALSRQVEKHVDSMAGKPIDYDDLNHRIRQLIGLGRFSAVNYEMIEKNNEPGLELVTHEKAYGPPMVQPLILIDGSNYKEALFNMGARITWMDIGGFRSEWRNDVILFSDYGLRSEYYHPFTPESHWFVAPRGNAESDPLYIYDGGVQIADYRTDTVGGGIDVGHIFGRTGELRIGYEGGWQRYARQTGDNTLPNFSGAFGDTRLQFRLNRVDDAVLPNRGQLLLATWRWTNTSPSTPNQYPAGEIGSQNYFRLSAPSSIFVNGFAGTTFGYETGIPQFSLGGPQRLVAYGENELLIDQYILGQAGYRRLLLNMPPLLGSGVYGSAMIEGGQVYRTTPLVGLGQLPNIPGDIAVSVIVKSLFGPVEFGYAYGETGNHKFYFRIGRLF
jgi:NTE family protein